MASEAWKGIALALCAASTHTAVDAVRKAVSSTVGTASLVCLPAVLDAVISCSVVGLTGGFEHVVFHDVHIFSTAVLASSALLLITKVMYQCAISTCPLSTTVPYLSFTPMFLVVTAYVFLGEELSKFGLIGVSIVTAGGYLLSKSTAPGNANASTMSLAGKVGARLGLHRKTVSHGVLPHVTSKSALYLSTPASAKQALPITDTAQGHDGTGNCGDVNLSHAKSGVARKMADGRKSIDSMETMTLIPCQLRRISSKGGHTDMLLALPEDHSVHGSTAGLSNPDHGGTGLYSTVPATAMVPTSHGTTLSSTGAALTVRTGSRTASMLDAGTLQQDSFSNPVYDVTSNSLNPQVNSQMLSIVVPVLDKGLSLSQHGKGFSNINYSYNSGSSGNNSSSKSDKDKPGGGGIMSWMTGSGLVICVAALWSVTASLDKLGVMHAPSVWVYFALQRLVIGSASWLYLAISSPQSFRLLCGKNLKYLLLISLLELLSVVLFLEAIRFLFVSYVVAIKRFNILMSVVLGGVVFRERIRHRLPYVLLMLLGMLLIVCDPGSGTIHLHPHKKV